MCGGAILADLIPSPRSGGHTKKNKRRRISDDEDFEAAFEEFDAGDDDSDSDSESEEVDEYDVVVDDDDSEDGVVVLPPPPPPPPVIPHERHGARRFRGVRKRPVGEVGGGDPRPRARRSRLARYLPHRRVRRARLRRRRPPPPRRQGQAQLPLRAAALGCCSPPQEAPRTRRHALAVVSARHQRGHGGVRVRVQRCPRAGVRFLRRRARARRRQVDADDEHTSQPAPPATVASENVDDPEVFDPYDVHGGLASYFAGGAYESLESLFAHGGDSAAVDQAASDHWPAALWSFADDGSFCF
ncbi:hypothetical protein OsJ_31388 [Oryza sativa Japonica Group]|uniref:Uncharacterized protein n=1 Tax=Oryza sativa subsp. japonica TaxID=39947 RepID=B9G5J9_ORYSJ|nr:hypothetical protein OsJ_31388 [Oryza sativa Japonica Group]